MAISPPQSCNNGLSVESSETDPFSTGPLHPCFEKSCLNQVLIYRIKNED